MDSGWDYWRPRGLHYLSQHHANRTSLREMEDLRWSAIAAAATTAEMKVILGTHYFCAAYKPSSDLAAVKTCRMIIPSDYRLAC